jgi:hypothetical protein
MQLFIYLELIESINFTNFKTYQKLPIEFVKNQFPEVLVVDFDNFSESYWVDYQIKLLDEFEAVFVYIASDKNAKVLGLMRFFEKLIRLSHKLRIVSASENQLINKILKPLGEKVIFIEPESLDYQNHLRNFLVHSNPKQPS